MIPCTCSFHYVQSLYIDTVYQFCISDQISTLQISWLYFKYLKLRLVCELKLGKAYMILLYSVLNFVYSVLWDSMNVSWCKHCHLSRVSHNIFENYTRLNYYLLQTVFIMCNHDLVVIESVFPMLVLKITVILFSFFPHRNKWNIIETDTLLLQSSPFWKQLFSQFFAPHSKMQVSKALESNYFPSRLSPPYLYLRAPSIWFREHWD